jgi:hypothetical protein
MKKNINILIESIIKNVIRDINKNYIIIETPSMAGLVDLDAEADLGADALTSINISEDLSEAVVALLGASLVTVGENIIPPTEPKIKTLASGAAGALYLIAGNYFWKLSDQAPVGSELRSYHYWQGIIYYVIGAVTLSFTAAGVASIVSALPANPNDVVNTTVVAHNIAKAASELVTLVKPSDIADFATSAIKKRTTLSNMGFNLKKLSGNEMHTFFINDGIMFKKIDGEDYIVLPDTATSQAIKADIDIIDGGQSLDDFPNGIVEVDINDFKNALIVTDNKLVDNVVEIPLDKITFKDMDVNQQSSMLDDMQKVDIDFSTSVNTARIKNAKTGYLASLEEVSMKIGKIERSMSSLSSFTNKELEAILEELDTLVSTNQNFAGIKLNQEEISTFLNGASNPETRKKIQDSLNALEERVVSLKQTKGNLDTASATGAPQRNSSGSEVDVPKTGLNRIKGEEEILGTWRGKAKRKSNIADMTNNLKTGQTKIVNSLSTNPIKINYPLTSRGSKILYSGELVILTYRSPGVFVGALSFKKEIQQLEALMAENLDDALVSLRKMESTAFSKYLNINPKNQKATLKKPAGEGKEAKMPKTGDEGYDDFLDNYTSYNRSIDNKAELTNKISELKKISASEGDEGIIPMAFDMDGHPDLRARAKSELGDTEFESLLALRKELKLSKKDSAWLKVWSKSTALAVYNNSSLVGIVLTASNVGVHSTESGWHLLAGQDVSISKQEINDEGEIIEVIPSETTGLKVVRELNLEEYYNED